MKCGEVRATARAPLPRSSHARYRSLMRLLSSPFLPPRRAAVGDAAPIGSPGVEPAFVDPGPVESRRRPRLTCQRNCPRSEHFIGHLFRPTRGDEPSYLPTSVPVHLSSPLISTFRPSISPLLWGSLVISSTTAV